MPLLLLLCYVAALGVLDLTAALAGRWTRCRAALDWPAPRLAAAAAVVLSVYVAAGLPQTLKRLHGNRAGNHEAGLWLAQRVKPGDLVLDDHTWSHYYAGLVFLENKPIPRALDHQARCYVVITRSNDPKVARLRDAWEKKWGYSNGTVVFHWPKTQAKEAARVVIYELPRLRLTPPVVLVKHGF
jgi:hypothetical protein